MKKSNFNRSQRLALVFSMLFSGAVGTVEAQDSVPERCPLHEQQQAADYRFQLGRADAEYRGSSSRGLFPEFDHLRDNVSQPRYRDTQSRSNDSRSRYQFDLRRSRYDENRYDENRVPRENYRSGSGSARVRDSEWERFHRNFDSPRSQSRDTRDRDYYYSGYAPARRSSDDRNDRYEDDTRLRSRDFDRSLDRGFDRDSSFDGNRARDLNRNLDPNLNRDFDSLREPLRPERDRLLDELRRPQPEPLRRNSEGPTAEQKLTFRYTNPTIVRFANSLSAQQGLALFDEVSQLIDARHLSPRSYSERVQHAARNLSLALETPAFRNAVPIRATAASIQSFRTQLDRIASQGARDRTEAARVVQTVMQAASQTLNLRPGLVAYEFTNGSIESLDKYSALDPALNRVSGAIEDTPTKTALAGLDDYVTGVGIEVRQHPDGLEIVRVLRGGPALEAGIQSGDIIRQINGRDIGGMELNESVALIGGNAGSSVQLLVVREGRGQKQFRLTRRRFRVYTVNDVRMADRSQGVGYLHLSKFATNSAAEMEEAVQELRSQGMRSLIVDVRGNPGGLLTTAIELSDKFLRCGRIVATRGRQSSDNLVETAHEAGTWSMPLVVLIDKDSASASEIFAAAIQENGRGIVIGERSYGKGTVQTHFPLRSGLGTVKLTTAKFYSPTDREMAGSGVTPDLHANDAQEALREAVSTATHPRLAEMVAEHGTCRPGGTDSYSFGSPRRPTNDLSLLLK